MLQVYVIRSNDFTEVDGALGLLNLDAQTKHNDAGMFLNSCVCFFIVSCMHTLRRFIY